MGVGRIVSERDVSRVAVWARDIWRGFDDSDVHDLSMKLYDPACYSGGILKITLREYRALTELNRRVMAGGEQAMLYPFLAWVEGRGLFQLRKAA